MSREKTINVLIGGYLSKDAALEDYQAAVDCGAELQGAVVITKALDGELTVEETDHLAKKGAKGVGAVGFAVGLFAPPLLAATAVGAALGAAGGSLVHHKIGGKIGEQAGDTIPLGGAGLIVAYEQPEGEKVEAAVTRAVQKVVGEADGKHVEALKGALSDAQEKMAESQQ